MNAAANELMQKTVRHLAANEITPGKEIFIVTNDKTHHGYMDFERTPRIYKAEASRRLLSITDGWLGARRVVAFKEPLPFLLTNDEGVFSYGMREDLPAGTYIFTNHIGWDVSDETISIGHAFFLFPSQRTAEAFSNYLVNERRFTEDELWSMQMYSEWEPIIELSLG